MSSDEVHVVEEYESEEYEGFGVCVLEHDDYYEVCFDMPDGCITMFECDKINNVSPEELLELGKEKFDDYYEDYEGMLELGPNN